MKTKLIILIIVIMLILVINVNAIVLQDNFDDASIDSTKWGTSISGDHVYYVTESGGKIEAKGQDNGGNQQNYGCLYTNKTNININNNYNIVITNYYGKSVKISTGVAFSCLAITDYTASGTWQPYGSVYVMGCVDDTYTYNYTNLQLRIEPDNNKVFWTSNDWTTNTSIDITTLNDANDWGLYFIGTGRNSAGTGNYGLVQMTNVTIDNRFKSFDITNTNGINNMTAYFNSTSYSTTNGTINTGINDSTEIFNITIEANEGNWQNRTYTNHNLSETLEATLISNTITITIKNYANTTMTSIKTIIGDIIETTMNPISTKMSILNPLGNATITYDLDVTDYTYYNWNNQTNITINENTTSYTIELEPNSLMIGFNKSVNGTIIDTECLINGSCAEFENSTFVIRQSQLALGQVVISFNTIDGVFAQIYEFINEGDFFTNGIVREMLPDIYILNDLNKNVSIRVQDVGGAEIEDAKVRIYVQDVGGTYVTGISNWKLAQQRLTSAEGYTNFMTNNSLHTMIVASKDSYTSESTKIITSGLEDEYVLILKKSSYFLGDMTIDHPQFVDRSFNMPFKAFRPSTDRLQITTSYRKILHPTNEWLDMIETGDWDVWTYTLEKGIDFDTTGTDDITITLKVNDLTEYTYVIEYLEDSTRKILDVTINTTLEVILLFIGIILLSLLASIVIKKESGEGFGEEAFFILMLLSTLITTKFILTSIVLAIALIASQIKGLIEQ